MTDASQTIVFDVSERAEFTRSPSDLLRLLVSLSVAALGVVLIVVFDEQFDGAVEAALIAALTAFGLPAQVAVPAVFLFRLVTFWIPILPGWLALRHLERSGAL